MSVLTDSAVTSGQYSAIWGCSKFPAKCLFCKKFNNRQSYEKNRSKYKFVKFYDFQLCFQLNWKIIKNLSILLISIYINLPAHNLVDNKQL